MKVKFVDDYNPFPGVYVPRGTEAQADNVEDRLYEDLADVRLPNSSFTKNQGNELFNVPVRYIEEV